MGKTYESRAARRIHIALQDELQREVDYAQVLEHVRRTVYARRVEILDGTLRPEHGWRDLFEVELFDQLKGQL